MRTGYQIAKVLRVALVSPMFPAGIYRPDEIVDRLVAEEIVTDRETRGRRISTILGGVDGWSHNGVKSGGSRWTKADDTPRLELPEIISPFDRLTTVEAAVLRITEILDGLHRAQGLIFAGLDELLTKKGSA